jgi:hypothetical protein
MQNYSVCFLKKICWKSKKRGGIGSWKSEVNYWRLGSKKIGRGGDRKSALLWKREDGIGSCTVLAVFCLRRPGKVGLIAEKMLNFKITAPFEGLMYCPFSKELSEYIKDTKKKQQNLEELDIWDFYCHKFARKTLKKYKLCYLQTILNQIDFFILIYSFWRNL